MLTQKTSFVKFLYLFIWLIIVIVFGFGLYTILSKSVEITTYPESTDVWLNGKMVSSSTPFTLHLWRWGEYHLELNPSSLWLNPVTYDFIGYQAPPQLSVLLQDLHGVASNPDAKWILEQEGDMLVVKSSDGDLILNLIPVDVSVDGLNWENRAAEAVFSPDQKFVLIESFLVGNIFDGDCGKTGTNRDTFLWLIPFDHPENRRPLFKNIFSETSSCNIGGFGFSPDGEWVYAHSILTDTSGQKRNVLWIIPTQEESAPQILSDDAVFFDDVNWSPDGQMMTVCHPENGCSFYTLDGDGVWDETGLVLRGIGAVWVGDDKLWYVDTSSAEQNYLVLYQVSSQQVLYKKLLVDNVAAWFRQGYSQRGDLLLMCVEYETVPDDSFSSVYKLIIADLGQSPHVEISDTKCWEPYFLGDGSHIAIYTWTELPIETGGYTMFYHTVILNIPPEFLK